jgi:hypothetical protein
VVESLADVFVEEPEIGRPVAGKECARDLTMLQKDEKHEGRCLISDSRSPPSTFRHPGLRFPSQGNSP